ncbi:MAG: hypothetical protein HPZ91_08650 [Lentisphaeria bacterium]|nr:hypothetical protein [Lentisphaeria bacterium]
MIERDAFGQTETASDHDFFTGKPHVGELGYAFLFRNYRANLGKWQTADPMGYPDGWNNLAYVNNKVIKSFDRLGLCKWVSPNGSFQYVPVGEKNAEAHTPPGYTYEPCHSVTAWETGKVCYEYYSATLRIYCGDCVDYYIPAWGGDDNTEPFHYQYAYDCHMDLDSHPGYGVVVIVMGVWLNPLVREFDCLREEIVDYRAPDSLFDLSYRYSGTWAKELGKACE